MRDDNMDWGRACDDYEMDRWGESMLVMNLLLP